MSVDDLAKIIALGHTKLFPTATIKRAFDPASKIIRDAVRQGGRIGAEKVQ
jgi:hypothetical protein